MKDLVLATVLHEKENLEYISNFERIVRETSPRLTPSGIKALCSEKPIVGQILESCFDCERVLKLKRLEAVERTYRAVERTYRYAVDNIEFVVGNIATDSGIYGLSVGSKNGGIEIFQEVYGRRSDVYCTEEYSSWIQVPKPFLQKTHSFLNSSNQQRFKELLQ
jgi:hypothetical protein